MLVPMLLLSGLFLFHWFSRVRFSVTDNGRERSWCLLVVPFVGTRWSLVKRLDVDPAPLWVRHESTTWILSGFIIESMHDSELTRYAEVPSEWPRRWDYVPGGYYQCVDFRAEGTWHLVRERPTFRTSLIPGQGRGMRVTS
jgi:hypothetical protein